MIPVQFKILVVDDELFFRKLYHNLLVEEGYHVDVCENGDEALKLLREQQFDLLVTDLVMPGQSGLDLLHSTRDFINPPDVILVTGHATLDSAIDALKNGAYDYLIKPFNPDELKHQVCNCLEQRKLSTDNLQLQQQIKLHQTGQSLSSIIEMSQLLPQSLDALLGEMDASIGCTFTLNNGVTPEVATLRNFTSELAEWLIDLLIPQLSDATSLCQPNSDISIKLEKLQLNYENIWMLPLRDGGAVDGGIIVCDAHSRSNSPLPIEDLNYLCEQVSVGFENSCRYRDAQKLMYTDDLTGLYNHRYLQIALNQEVRRSQRYGLKFSLLFLDLDRFKEINDNYGHLAGSAALQEVGRLLVECVRDVDTLFRFGGDEFAAILVETDDRTARVVAERIRKVIEEFAFLEDRNMASYVTVSAGFATYPTDTTEKVELLELADKAMYAGKVSRNTICGVKDIAENLKD